MFNFDYLQQELLVGQEQVNQLLKKKETINQKLDQEKARLTAQQKLVETALGKVEETTAAAQEIIAERIEATR